MAERDVEPTEEPASSRMMRFVFPAIGAAQAIYAAAELRLADLIGDRARSVDDLASESAAEASTLRRLMRALATLGVFSEAADGRFRNTHLSDTLRSDHAGSMRDWVVFLASPLCWKPWGELAQTVRIGRPPFERIFGAPFYEYLATHPDQAKIFNAAMSSGSSRNDLAEYDLSQFRKIADIGGGQGALLSEVLSSNPKLRAVLFDLPQVVKRAALSADVSSRCEVVGGNFFEAVPEGADVYVLRGVIHNWSDNDAIRILSNCRRAIAPGGVLLLLETVLGASQQPGDGLMDLMMLVLVGGKERTEMEFRELLSRAGFSLSRVIPTAGHSIVEAHPIQSLSKG